MQDPVSNRGTVKHRLGLDDDDSYGFVRAFVGTLYDEGVRTFVVHARNAILGGLSPNQTREIPPLRYEAAAALTRDFPQAQFILNGGIKTASEVNEHFKKFSVSMIGRASLNTLWGM